MASSSFPLRDRPSAGHCRPGDRAGRELGKCSVIESNGHFVSGEVLAVYTLSPRSKVCKADQSHLPLHVSS